MNQRDKPSNQMERRMLNLTKLRVNEPDSENKQPIIEGHAAVFNQYSEELGNWFPFKEKISPGAFSDSIAADDIRALFNHSPNYVLGRNKAGTLSLSEDDQGLKVRIIPPETSWARDLNISIARGDISQMSIGFVVQSEKWGKEDGMDIREITKVKLYDVSPVTFPAYPQTDVGIRSITDVWNQRSNEIRRLEEKRQKLKLLQLKQELYEKDAP